MPMAIGFIFMATRRDRTVPQARALIEEALALGVATSASRTSACRARR